MTHSFFPLQAACILAAALFLSNARISVSAPFPGESDGIELTALFPDAASTPVTFSESIIASLLLGSAHGKPLVIVPVSNGTVAMLDADTGLTEWTVDMPTPPGQKAQLVATPVRVGDLLIILYQCLDQGIRTSHRLVVVDMAQRRLDDGFPALELSAEKSAADKPSKIGFNPPTAFSHAALKHAVKKGKELGIVYASFGNAGDTQPFHGWMFEIDLDAWRQQGAHQAVSGVLLTTPEPECPVTIEYGTQEMICGGGIWTPAGPPIYPAEDDYEILVSTGNGQIDLNRRDFANTLMRLKPGLEFDPGCDGSLCANFKPAFPDTACLESCRNLFIPRLSSGNARLKPANGECDDKRDWECLAWMDYDLGANAPVKAALPDGRSVLVQPGKDGGVYLLDADHLGTQYDRLQIVDVCGTSSDPCGIPWAGMIVTQPVLSYLDETPVVVIPTFMPDKSHAAGLVALKIVLENGSPKLERFWQFPEPSSAVALSSFRTHPSLPVLSHADIQGGPVVWIVDIGVHGTIYGVRVSDGALLAKAVMRGTGRPLAAPLIHRDLLYATSTRPDTHEGLVEMFRISGPKLNRTDPLSSVDAPNRRKSPIGSRL
ncbi:MAG: hypothetical protein ACU841_06015 [Gammaproteobacteria bacterium]